MKEAEVLQNGMGKSGKVFGKDSVSINKINGFMLREDKVYYGSGHSTTNKKFYKDFLPFFILLLFFAVPSCKKETSCEGCSDNNKPPIAIAGPDQVITLPADSISLDGAASNDPDGTISGWLWKKITGPASFTILTTTSKQTRVKGLMAGTYLFELKVTDDKNLSARDTVQVVVADASQTNRPPVANAGADQTIIILPATSVSLNGSGSTDPDNNISGYQWSKISGPSSFTIANATAVQIQVSNLEQGAYQFELKVTDGEGLFDKDTMQVTVINTPPPCTDCKIVFVSDRDGNTEIYSCKVDGSGIQRLTYSAGVDEYPAWSPDGSRIAFISDRTGGHELYVMNADGSNVVRRTFSGDHSMHPAWSPDGSKIAYSTLSNGSSNIWVVNAAGGPPSLLFEKPGWEGYPAWSPDGTKIALVSDWMAYDLVSDIYTINADGTGFTALTGNIFDHFDYVYPTWSPNAAKIALAITQTIGIDLYNTQVGVMNSNGSGLTAIMPSAAPWTRTSWSGDGTKIVYTSLSGSVKNVSWVLADGSAHGLIVTNGWNADWLK